MRRLTIAAAAASLLAAGIAHAQSDAKHGQKLFEECHACHAVERGVNGVGPSLYGIFGRRAAELDDFRYSPALKKSGITWTPKTLDAYIADPQKAVPANRMPYAGMPEARDRADLILYMQQVFK
ncbi:MAG TPA: cytochrome c family protein [Steroidobacteraceae bacterium]|nr:cytochrome c family protein [Steroidobacteraceae bacterium]